MLLPVLPSSLASLNVAGNHIQELSSISFGAMRSLSKLNVSRNLLATLPATLAELPNAVHLDFSSNALTTLPPELTRLSSKKLLTLNIKNNPFEDARFSSGMAPKALLQIIKKKPPKAGGGGKKGGGAEERDEQERQAAREAAQRRQAARRAVEVKMRDRSSKCDDARERAREERLAKEAQRGAHRSTRQAEAREAMAEWEAMSEGERHDIEAQIEADRVVEALRLESLFASNKETAQAQEKYNAELWRVEAEALEATAPEKVVYAYYKGKVTQRVVDDAPPPVRPRGELPYGVKVIEPYQLWVDRSLVGYLIGREGTTIKKMQADSKASITISSDCVVETSGGIDFIEIMIHGDVQQIDNARIILLDTIHAVSWKQAGSSVGHLRVPLGGKKSLGQRLGGGMSKRPPPKVEAPPR